MTPQEVNRAIAAITKPVTLDLLSPVKCESVVDTERGTLTFIFTPNYYESLEACAQFEATLKTHELELYGELIAEHFGLDTDHYNGWNFSVGEAAKITMLPATKRCEFFLRVHGKFMD